jgi:hypothetical protein
LVSNGRSGERSLSLERTLGALLEIVASKSPKA